MNNIDTIKLDLISQYIKNSNFNSIIEKVESYLNNPFFVFDSSFVLLYTSSKDPGKGVFLKKYQDKYIISMDGVDEINNSNILESVDESSGNKPNIYTFDDKNILIKKLADGDNCLGYLCVLEKDHKIKDEDKEIANIIGEILVHDLSINGYNNSTENIIYTKILDGEYKNSEDLDKILENAGIVNHKKMRTLVIKTKKASQTLEYILNNNDIPCFTYKSDVVGIIREDRTQNKEMLEKVLKSINDKDTKFGISDEFENYKELQDSYKEALKSIELGEKYYENNRINYFDDYRLLSMISRLSKKEVFSLLDKRILSVVEYDQNHKNKYFQDIETYLDSGRNIKKASEMLYVHKNSMYYRLTKIKELFDIDLENKDDCFNIELSLKLLKATDFSL